ncbi:sulfatase-like hydrolase/transferase [Wohlfahrtiimonas larvae]|nr:sulfatase-like hydrolase/transferase [Wohlfahrtiimonas larvae]
MKTYPTQIIRVIYFSLLLLIGIGIALYEPSLSLFGLVGFFTAISIFALWLGLSGRVKQSILVTIFILLLLQLMNTAKIYYFKSRLFFSDFLVALDDNNFDTLNQYWEMYVVIVVLSIIIIATFYIYRKDWKTSGRVRCCSILISLFIGFSTYQITLAQDSIREWQLQLPSGKGVLVNIWMSLGGAQYESPVFSGSDELFLQEASKIQLEPMETIKPDIVVFLQESTSDRDYFLLDEKKLPKLSMFNPEAEFVSAYGPLRLQTSGGGTWLSEFSFATGLSTNDFSHRKYSVFYTVAPHINYSFYKELKNNGYYTVLLTPMTKNNYNTSNAYTHFGIDLILQPQDLGYDAPINENLWKISSHEMLEYVSQILEKYTDKPVAVFVLSMNEHGPYDDTVEDAMNLAPYFENEKLARRLNDYLSRQELLNDATDHFAYKVLNRQEPTLFLYFGDHQPSLFGKVLKDNLFINPWTVTQFFMKDNFEGKEIPIRGSLTDINFLSGIILERIHANVSPYYDANIKMRYLCEGKLEDCENQELVNSYKYYIYNTLKAADASMK